MQFFLNFQLTYMVNSMFIWNLVLNKTNILILFSKCTIKLNFCPLKLKDLHRKWNPSSCHATIGIGILIKSFLATNAQKCTCIVIHKYFIFRITVYITFMNRNIPNHNRNVLEFLNVFKIMNAQMNCQLLHCDKWCKEYVPNPFEMME